MNEEIISQAATDISIDQHMANIISLIDKAARRQDDLRAADQRFNTSEVRRLDDLAIMRHGCDQEILAVHLQSQKDLATAESRRLDLAALAEQRRIDAINSAAKSDIALAAERTSAQAATLAAQVLTSAETLRAQAAATASVQSAQVQRLQETLEARISPLEQSRYQIGGRDIQRDESRQGGQWGTNLIAFIALSSITVIISAIAIVVSI